NLELNRARLGVAESIAGNLGGRRTKSDLCPVIEAEHAGHVTRQLPRLHHVPLVPQTQFVNWLTHTIIRNPSLFRFPANKDSCVVASPLRIPVKNSCDQEWMLEHKAGISA